MPQTARRGPGRPPAAKAADTRKRILRAAREVFSERGYDGATFQAIAIRAELTRPAINHYFSSKRALYREVLKQTTELVVALGVERAQAETRLADRLSAFFAAAIPAAAENPPAAAFLTTAVLESQRHPELSRGERGPMHTLRAFVTRGVNDAIERGEITTDSDVESLINMVLAILCGVGFYAGFVGGLEDVEVIADRLRQLMGGTLWRLAE